MLAARFTDAYPDHHVKRSRGPFILKALEMLENQGLEIDHTKDDEDVQAEYGMDAALLQITREKLETAAVKIFSPHVKNFPVSRSSPLHPSSTIYSRISR